MKSSELDPEFERLLELLKHQRGFDFTGYKRSSLMRRVKKRVQAPQPASFAECLDHLEAQPEEFAQLFNTILINVTGFFRDAVAWETPRREHIPRIVTGRAAARYS